MKLLLLFAKESVLLNRHIDITNNDIGFRIAHHVNAFKPFGCFEYLFKAKHRDLFFYHVPDEIVIINDENFVIQGAGRDSTIFNSDGDKVTACKDCVAGKSSVASGMTACTTCLGGTVATPAVRATACVTCAAGSKCDGTMHVTYAQVPSHREPAGVANSRLL